MIYLINKIAYKGPIMNVYQAILFTGLIVNLHANSLHEAIHELRKSGYRVVTITQVKHNV